MLYYKSYHSSSVRLKNSAPIPTSAQTQAYIDKKAPDIFQLVSMVSK